MWMDESEPETIDDFMWTQKFLYRLTYPDSYSIFMTISGAIFSAIWKKRKTWTCEQA